MNEIGTFLRLQAKLKLMPGGVWRRLCPRTYAGAAGWCPPSVPATFLAADVYQALMYKTQEASRIMTTGCQLARYGVPTFHVGRDLLDAVRQTAPPPTATWGDLPFPFRSGLFLFPAGGVSGSGRAWGWTTWTVCDQGERIPVPHDGSGVVTIDSDHGLRTVSVTYGAAYPDGRLDGALFRTHLAGDPLPAMADNFTHAEVCDTLLADERAVGHEMSRIVANLLLAMAARPELVERTGTKVRAVKKGDAREEWTPNWVGRTYRLQRPAAGDGTHASPRLHWRRGHYRRQPCGAGRKDHKVIWLEPVLVGDTGEPPTTP